jgi:hypothetical protein
MTFQKQNRCFGIEKSNTRQSIVLVRIHASKDMHDHKASSTQIKCDVTARGSALLFLLALRIKRDLGDSSLQISKLKRNDAS